MLETWQRNNDAAKGERAIKDRTTRYLPVPNPDETDVDGERYQSYLKRAVYVNYTGRTLKGLTGAVFRKDAAVELPTQIEYMLSDANNAGLSLQTIGQRAVSETLRAGRFVLLADYPKAPSNNDIPTDEDTKGLRAYIACYSATALINWHETRGVLDLAVLHEVREEANNEFDYDLVDYYRVLRLRQPAEDNTYTATTATIQLYREETVASDEVPIRGSDGTPFDRIPLVVIGSEDNNLSPDEPPISGIASLNIAHYRNSADYEEGVFTHGQPMLHIDTGETNAADFKKANGKLIVGTRAATVTQGGSMSLVQAEANGAAMEAMTHKETQMVRLGAQIISDAKGQETAEAARIRSGAETSVLNQVVRNTSEAFTQALRWCALYMGGNPDEVSYKLNEQFFDQQADPQLLAQMWMGIDRQAWPVSVVQDYARRSGLVEGDVTNEELSDEAGQASPLA
jgi:hypothetical protein